MTALSRRSFLKYGAGAVAGSVMVNAVPSAPTAGVRHAAPRPRLDSDIEELTVAQLQESMRSGARTSHAICAAYLARIAELDPKLRSVIETNPEALAIADRLDADRKAGR